MSYLVDTNILSELRKGERTNPRVRAWFLSIDDSELFLSVLVIGEVRRGIERIRVRDPASASALDVWLSEIVAEHDDRILPVDRAVSEIWGRLSAGPSLPVIDTLLAAAALVHGLTLVSRNERAFEKTGVPVLNPFAS